MNSATDEFLLQSPTKILERAEIYSKTLNNYLELPKEASKSLVVKSIAHNQKEEIEYAIQMSQYQQELFKNKEKVDQQQRQRHRKVIELKNQKVNHNITEIDKKNQKRNQDYEKHLKLVHDRYVEEENRHRATEKEKSYQIRNGLIEFFEKQHKRKQQAQRRQVSVGGCYQDAVERINNIHKKNEEYAKAAEMTLGRDLAKNSKYDENICKKRRVLTQNNRRKDRVYRHSLSILDDREKQFIQTCGKNEDGFLKAWQKIGNTITDFRKKRNEEVKKQLERWKSNKQRVDESESQIPERCVNILDKTSRASFRQTASSFRSSATKYEEIVQHNKDVIREEDEKKKDQIMSLHLDLRLRNTASSKITQKMHSMRHHAKKIAYDCL